MTTETQSVEWAAGYAYGLLGGFIPDRIESNDAFNRGAVAGRAYSDVRAAEREVFIHDSRACRLAACRAAGLPESRQAELRAWAALRV